MFYKLLVALACVVAACLADPVVFKDCGSVGGTIKTVDVTPCPAEPCVLHHGTNISIKMDFTSKEAATKVMAVVHGIIGGIPIPFPIDSPDACSNGVKCPLKPADENMYTNHLFVQPSYPKIQLLVKWELKDEHTNVITCFVVPVKIDD